MRQVLTTITVVCIAAVSASAAIPLFEWGNRCPLTGAYGTQYVGNHYDETRQVYNTTDIVSYRFTAGVSATVEYLRWSHATGKLNGTPNITLSLAPSDANGLPDMSSVLTSASLTVSAASGSPTTQFSSPVGLTAGNVYHLVWEMDPNDIDPGDPNNIFTQNGTCFRLTTQAQGNAVANGKAGIRMYDGSDDSQLAVLYHATIDPNADYLDPNDYVWGEGSPFDLNKAGKEPKFELLDSNQNPVPPLGHSDGQYRDWLNGVGMGYGHRFDANGVWLRTVLSDSGKGQTLDAPPAASPDVYELYIYAHQATSDGPDPNDPNNSYWGGSGYYPDGDLWLQIRGADPNDPNDVYGAGQVRALVVVPKANVPASTGWVGGQLRDPNDPNQVIKLSLDKGERFSITAVRDPNMTVGSYQVAIRRYESGSVPSVSNSYYGTDSHGIDIDFTDTTPTWSAATNDDYIFRLKMVIPGDADGNEQVSIGDLTILAANYNKTGKTWGEGDFTSDGSVSIGDLTVLAAHYSEHMPEPATVGLLAAGACLLLGKRRRS